jgi:glutamate N-acetyltransferase/amino-acid N-acetyltransferase
MPTGFQAAAVAAGLKPSGGLDVGLLVSDRPAIAAGVFTKNRVVAAPVTLAKRTVRSGRARAIVVNAGNANACTGPQGVLDAETMQRVAGEQLGIVAEDIVPASTGIIGVPLDIRALTRGIEAAAASLGDEIEPFVDAMMTTDTVRKIASTTIRGSTITGVAKGAGMIAPELATMLCFVATDAALDAPQLRTALQEVSAATFDRISVDGCMSTNDTVVVLANGAIGSGDPRAFKDALREICTELTRAIVEDGEGAGHVIDLRVTGARTPRMADACARSVAGSVLFRCAVAGGDPNWGRILAALGAAGQPIDPDRIRVEIGGVALCVDGARGPGSLEAAARAMRERTVLVAIDLGLGDASAKLATNDLTAEYVRINAEYTT